MIANDSVGTAKYYSGQASAWTNTYWTSGTSAGNRATGYYVLNLHANPIAAMSTDGTCADAPIGGQSCGAYASYLSSAIYNKDADGGTSNRAQKTYWELDLGAMKNIKKIQFIGCKYVASSDTTTAVASTLAMPNADQITGMRIELYSTSNLATAKPIVTRTLGPEANQTITFNFTTVSPGIDDRCYDECPRVNGVQSSNGGNQTCITATGGITSRSVTSPLPLPDPVCNIPTTPTGDIASLPGNIANPTGGSVTPGAITKWIIDPTNKLRIISCEELKNSKLILLNNRVKIPYMPGTTETSEISYTLQKTNGTLYTNPRSPYMCIVPSDDLCSMYNQDGKVYKYHNDLCVRMDNYPVPLTGDGTIGWGARWSV
jgi:hypothetical protein